MELKEDEIHSEGRLSIPFEHALLLSLWLPATPESFRSVADRFGIDRGHAHVLCLSICKKMYDRRNTWIRRPRGMRKLSAVCRILKNEASCVTEVTQLLICRLLCI